MRCMVVWYVIMLSIPFCIIHEGVLATHTFKAPRAHGRTAAGKRNRYSVTSRMLSPRLPLNNVPGNREPLLKALFAAFKVLSTTITLCIKAILTPF